MNEPEDRPTPSDPPGDPAGEPVEPETPEPVSTAEPSATWEDVVDPEPIAPAQASPLDDPAAPEEPAPPAEPVTDDWPEPNRLSKPLTAPSPTLASPAAEVAVDDQDHDGEDYDDRYDEEPVSRWVSLLATIGSALIGIVTVQVITSLVEGAMLDSGQRLGAPDDLFHRLGYPFGGLGATALVFLVLGVVLVSMPSVLDEPLSEARERLVGLALVVAIAMGVLIAIGSLLAVRANLHLYAARNEAVPSYVRVQFTNFLLGALGTAALALFGSIAAISERARERLG